jgi:NitT/TauT family transport system substrate-binding protein
MGTVSINGVKSSNRRSFLGIACAFGAASLVRLPRAMAGETPPETKKVRLVHTPTICLAPQYLAEELLRLEGFTEVEYVEPKFSDPVKEIEAGRADLTLDAATAVIPLLDEGKDVVVLAGVHGGCYELIGTQRVSAIRDLKRKRVAIVAFGSADHVFLASILAYVGMDPRNDIEWVEADDPTKGVMPLFVDGKVDAFLAFPPEPQELRARRIGHTIVDTSQDRPWSQYFCCMATARRQFVQANPIATKRALRAILKATDLCAQEPERAARFLEAKGYESRYEIGLGVLKALDYKRWRESPPEDTLRFHALRLHEVGMIKSTPQKIIARGTDWRFLDELKKELKA